MVGAKIMQNRFNNITNMWELGYFEASDTSPISTNSGLRWVVVAQAKTQEELYRYTKVSC